MERGIEANLFFRRLLHGVDVSIKQTSDPMEQLRFQIAKQMKNYSYLLGDNKIKKCLIVDPCWDPKGFAS